MFNLCYCLCGCMPRVFTHVCFYHGTHDISYFNYYTVKPVKDNLRKRSPAMADVQEFTSVVLRGCICLITSKHQTICKQCSFECDIGKNSTRLINKVRVFRRTPYSLNMCCMFPYCAKNEQRLYFLTRSRHTWHFAKYCSSNYS